MNDKPTYEELVLLVESQQKKIAELDNLFSIFPGLICMAGTDGYFRYLNSEWEKTLGFSLEELLFKPLLDFIHPDDLEPTRKEIEKQIDGGSTFNFENRYRCKDGSYRTLEWRATASVDGNLFAIARDISDRRRAEQELLDSEQRYRTILQTAMDGFIILDLEGHLLDVNDSYCRMIGYTRDELLQMRISDIEAVETPQDTSLRMKKIMTHGQDRFETRHRHKDGRTLDMEVSVQYRLADGSRMISFVRDITEKKRRQEDIRLRSLVLDQINDHVTITDMDGKITYVNQAVVRKINCPIEELCGKSTIVYGEDPLGGATQREILEKTISDGYWRGEVVNVTADGSKLIMDCRTQIVYDTQGVPKALCGVSTDITEYKRSEYDLQESKLRLNRAEIASKSGNWELHLDSRTIIGSDGALIIYGVPNNVLEYSVIKNIPLPEYRPLLDTTLKNLIEKNIPYDIEFKIQTVDTKQIKDIHSIAFMNREKRTVFGIIQDITERKKAEDEKARLETRLQQAQKMEAIGLLAGGIAHDLNNMLFPISGLSEMLLDVFPADNPWHESIEQIHKSAHRGSDLVKQILAFSRQSDLEKQPLCLQPILKEVLTLSRATIPQHIALTSQIETDCGMIFANPTQVHQILMNLITNAYHAVEQAGGAIHVGLKERLFHKTELHDNSLKAGGYVCISVHDTGTGIDQALVGKIFDPYFTTKAHGKGTGIGLSVVHGIVKEYGGDIQVFSDVEKGTTFEVYLPLLEKAGDRTPAGIVGEHPTGNESVLLIDDEAPIVRMVRMMLEKLGYRVTAYTNGPDALNDFTIDPWKFDIVISDRSMPHMSGIQLAEKLISIRPETPIIICTGFLNEDDERIAGSIGVKGFLLKPVGISDLARMVRKVLDEMIRQ